jgi:TATA-binding protein-associated factor
MDTDLVLDLFRHTTEGRNGAGGKKKQESTGGAVGQKSVLEGLEELPAEDEYEDLDLSSFMGSIGR